MQKENSSTRKSVFYYLLTYIVVMAAAGMIVPSLYKLIMSKQGGVNAAIVTSVVYSVILFVLFYRLKWCPISSTFLRSKPWVLLVWTVLFAFGAILPGMFIQDLLKFLPDIAGDQIAALINSDFGYVTVCLFAPLVEEMVFRGAVLRSLLDGMKSRWGAIAVSALLFALVHMNPAQMPYAFLAGLFLGWIYSRTRSIVLGVAFHWVNNTLVYLLYRMMPQMADASFSDMFGGDTKREVLAIVFSLFILLPSLYQLVLRTKKQ